MKISWLHTLLVGGWALCPLGAAIAGGLSVEVQDPEGNPVQHAVVYLLQQDGSPIPGAAGTAVMSQRDSRFVPPVIAANRGSRITFLNEDSTRHHVYSFSEAKVFETKLYAREEAPSIQFETPGHVALGCNIHDWMAAHILVLDTPHYALTDASGTLQLEDVPAGKYLLTAWHPGTPPRDLWKQGVQVDEAAGATIRAVLPIAAPLTQERQLSPLELKLRKATSGQ